jgi:hypothetical protein
MPLTPEPSPEDQFPRDELIVLAINSILVTFTTEVAQYRELVRIVSKSVPTLGDRPTELIELGKAITHQQRQTAEKAAKNAREEFKSVLTDMYGPLDEPVQEANYKRYPPSQEQLFALTMFNLGQTKAREFVLKLIHECGDRMDVARYAFEYTQWLNQESRSTVLAKSLLSSVLANFESLIASLIRIWFLLDESAAGIDDNNLSIKEAKQYEYTSEFVRKLVDGRVDKIMRKRPDELRDELKKALEIDLCQTFSDWNIYLEAQARRNALMHNNGLVDEDYLKQSPVGAKLLIRTPLDFSIEYFNSVLDSLEAASAVLVFAWIAHFAPGAATTPEIASERVLRALSQKRWHDARRMASFGLKGQPADHEHHELRVNEWMARRELGDDPSVLKQEIAQWQPPIDDPRYKVAIAALLDDEIGTIEALKEVAEDHGDAARLSTWPLLEEMALRSDALARWMHSVKSRSSRSNSTRPEAKRPKRRR